MEWRWMHPWMNDVVDGCLTAGEGTTEKISEFQVGIQPTTSVTPVSWYVKYFDEDLSGASTLLAWLNFVIPVGGIVACSHQTQIS